MTEPFMQAIDWNNDSMVGNIGKLYQNVDTALDTGPAWANALSYMLPVVGTARTFGDAFENFGMAGDGEDDAMDFLRGLGDLGLGVVSLIPGIGGLASTALKGAKALGKAGGAFTKLGKGAEAAKAAKEGASLIKPLEGTQKPMAAFFEALGKEGGTLGDAARAKSLAKGKNEAIKAANTEIAETAKQIPKLRADFSQSVSALDDAALTKLLKTTASQNMFGKGAKVDDFKNALKSDKEFANMVTKDGTIGGKQISALQKGIDNVTAAPNAGAAWDFMDALRDFWRGEEGFGRGARAGAAGTRAFLADLLNGGNYDEDYYTVEQPTTTWAL